MHVLTISPTTLFQALSDPTRLRIIRLLAITKQEACLCELVDALLEPQYNISRHLKMLRQSGFLSAQKEGRWVYHKLIQKPEYLKQLYQVIQLLPDPGSVYQADLERFNQRMSLRENNRCRTGILSHHLQAGNN